MKENSLNIPDSILNLFYIVITFLNFFFTHANFLDNKKNVCKPRL